MVISPSSDNEIREVCFSKSINESPRYDKISFIVIKNRFGALCEPPQLAKGSSQMIQKL